MPQRRRKLRRGVSNAADTASQVLLAMLQNNLLTERQAAAIAAQGEAVEGRNAAARDATLATGGFAPGTPLEEIAATVRGRQDAATQAAALEAQRAEEDRQGGIQDALQSRFGEFADRFATRGAPGSEERASRAGAFASVQPGPGFDPVAQAALDATSTQASMDPLLSSPSSGGTVAQPIGLPASGIGIPASQQRGIDIQQGVAEQAAQLPGDVASAEALVPSAVSQATQIHEGNRRIDQSLPGPETGSNPTEKQVTAGLVSSGGIQANTDALALEQSFTQGPTGRFTFLTPGSEDSRLYQQSKNAYFDLLRTVSGAAIPPDEVRRMDERFFAVSLDTQEVLNRKQRDRTQHLIGQITISGPVGESLGASVDDVILAVGDAGAWHALTPDQQDRYLQLAAGG